MSPLTRREFLTASVTLTAGVAAAANATAALEGGPFAPRNSAGNSRDWPKIHGFNYSMIADAHRPELGSGSTMGSFAFIEADGSLRPGHEVFNEF